MTSMVPIIALAATGVNVSEGAISLARPAVYDKKPGLCARLLSFLAGGGGPSHGPDYTHYAPLHGYVLRGHLDRIHSAVGGL